MEENEEFPIDKTMVVLKMPFESGEDTGSKITALLKEMRIPQNVNVTRVARLPQTGNRPIL